MNILFKISFCFIPFLFTSCLHGEYCCECVGSRTILSGDTLPLNAKSCRDFSSFADAKNWCDGQENDYMYGISSGAYTEQSLKCTRSRK